MKHIGNQNHWIPEELLKTITTTQGVTKSLYNEPTLSDRYRKLAEPWFSSGQQTYQEFSVDLAFDDLQLPEVRKHITYSIIKLNPGQLQFLHNESFDKTKNPVRYTMFLTDWSIGHIFEYGDEMLSEFKKGDIFQWTDPEIEYCLVNIGYDPAYFLQIDFQD